MYKKSFSKKLLMLVIAFCLAFVSIPAGSISVSAAKVKNGWVKEKGGYSYYQKGKKLKSQWITIRKKDFYLGSDGLRKENCWYTTKDKKNKKKYTTYYFNSNGVMKKSKAIDKLLVETMDKVIKNKKITDSTADDKAIDKLFIYAKSSFQYNRAPLGFSPAKTYKGWEYNFAKEMLTKKRGSCYHDAAAFAFLVRRATGADVRICLGNAKVYSSKWQLHAWVQIKVKGKWYTYDTNAARFSKLKNRNWYKQKDSSAKKYYKATSYVNVEL